MVRMTMTIFTGEHSPVNRMTPAARLVFMLSPAYFSQLELPRMAGGAERAGNIGGIGAVFFRHMGVGMAAHAFFVAPVGIILMGGGGMAFGAVYRHEVRSMAVVAGLIDMGTPQDFCCEWVNAAQVPGDFCGVNSWMAFGAVRCKRRKVNPVCHVIAAEVLER